MFDGCRKGSGVYCTYIVVYSVFSQRIEGRWLSALSGSVGIGREYCCGGSIADCCSSHRHRGHVLGKIACCHNYTWVAPTLDLPLFRVHSLSPIPI